MAGPCDPRIGLSEGFDAEHDLWAGFREMDRRLEAIRTELAHHHRLTTLGTMAATIAHEINNLLTPVGSYAQLALSRPDDPQLAEKALRQALAGAERAARIADSILGLTQQRQNGGACDVHAAIEDTLACLVRDPGRDGIDVAIESEPGLTAAIEADQLVQVLLNLALNACRAMGRRGGRLALASGTQPQPDGERVVWVEVRDTGPGIPAAIRDRLFEPFVTSPSSAADETSRGTGLGLSVCRQLIDAAGGTIDFTTRSADDPSGSPGTTFRIVLPAAAAAADRATPPSGSAMAA
ncbi:MAG: HAMP domain-containing sensor histidine kinase [Planctomycetota bacterium]